MLKETYYQMKERQQEEVNALPMKAAFSNEQFKRVMQEWGLDPQNDLDKIYSLGYGCYCQRKDSDLIHSTFNRHDKELKEAFKDDDFLTGAFEYELANHEYCITYDYEDTLNALGITFEDLKKNERMVVCLRKAEKNYLGNIDEM